jgi:hypothetical protein
MVCDVAGNCAGGGPIGGNLIDRKPPTITISVPVDATYVLHQPVAASYACTDGGSGVATCTGPVPTGSDIPTASVGSNSFMVNATDKVGNAASQTVRYAVSFKLCVLYDQSRAVQSGSTIPVKLQLCDYHNADVSSTVVVVHAASVMRLGSNAALAIQNAGDSNPSNDFRFDSSFGSAGGYIFNLGTNGLPTGQYLLNVTAGADPTTHSVMFQIR